MVSYARDVIAVVLVVVAARIFLPVAADGPSDTRPVVVAVPAAPGPSTTASPTPTATRTGSPTATATATATPSPTVAPPVGPPPPASAPPATATPTSTTTVTPTPTATTTPTATPTIALFVLAGQSNMHHGEGRFPEAPEDRAIEVTVGLWSLRRPASGTIAVPVGPPLGFARTLARAGVARIGLVGCAVAGSPIANWRPGGADYDACLGRVRALGLPVAAVLFAQGESDAWPDAAAPRPDAIPRHRDDWGEQFAGTVAAFRADLGADTPVLLARLAHADQPDRGGAWAVVRAQQDAVAIPGVALIESEPATLRDPVHLDDASYAVVGERLAEAYLATRPDHVSGPTVTPFAR